MLLLVIVIVLLIEFQLRSLRRPRTKGVLLIGISMPRAHAEKRNMVFPEQRGAAA